MFRLKKKKYKNEELEKFIAFLDNIKFNFKEEKEVKKEYSKLLQLLKELHIEELEALRYAEIIFKSSRFIT